GKFILEGLQPLTSYCVAVRADDVGRTPPPPTFADSAFSIVFAVTTTDNAPPTVPTNLTQVEPTTTKSVTMQFGASFDNAQARTAGAPSYLLFYAPQGEAASCTGFDFTGAQTTAFTPVGTPAPTNGALVQASITNLTPGTSYCVAAKAIGANTV